MHKHQVKFCQNIKKNFPEYFKNQTVLDVGSLDINGNNKHLFTNCNYIGLDVVAGNNVDIVCPVHEYQPDFLFDTIISTNAFEHDMYYKESLKAIIKLLKPAGLFFFSCANSWKEHGTLRTNANASGTTQIKEWANYYKNLDITDINEIYNLKKIFSKYDIKISKKDLQFWGIKKI